MDDSECEWDGCAAAAVLTAAAAAGAEGRPNARPEVE